MTDTAENADLARAAALAALLAGTPTAEEPKAVVTPTGREVYAGGKVKRVLQFHASLQYPTDDVPPVYQRALAVPGDTVLLTDAEAERLDALGATLDPDALPEPEPTAEPDVRDDGTWSDAKLAGANVPDIAAYVGQYPDERPRVRAAEEAKPKPRAGVLSATEPTPELDAERAAQQAAKAAEDAAAAQAEADKAAAAQQEAQEADEAARAEADAAEALAKLANGGSSE